MVREQDVLWQIERLPKIPTPPPVREAMLRLAHREGQPKEELLALLAFDLGLACQLLRDNPSMRLPLPKLPTLDDIARRHVQQQLLALLDDEAPPGPGATQAPPAPAVSTIDEQDRQTTRPLDEDRPEENLWGHALATGLGCQLLAQHLGKPHPDTAFLAGLLHDLGKSALLAAHRSLARQVRFVAVRERLPYHEAERRSRVPPHTQLGHVLACRWGLPRSLRQTIYLHHEPNPLLRGDIEPLDSFLVDLVIVADGMARRLQLGNPFDPMGSPAWGALTRKRIGLDRGDLTMLSLKLSRSFQGIVQDLFDRSPSVAAAGDVD